MRSTGATRRQVLGTGIAVGLGAAVAGSRMAVAAPTAGGHGGHDGRRPVA